MKHRITIGELMSKLSHTVEGSDTVERAKQLMIKHGIRHLPVLQEEQLLGVLTDRDIHLAQGMSKVENFEQETFARDICVADVYVVNAHEPAYAVLSHLHNERIGFALIEDGSDLVGIFTLTDACRVLASQLQES